MKTNYCFTNKLIPAIVTFFSVFNTMAYFSQRTFWSGIHSMTGMSSLAYILFAFLVAMAISCVVMMIVKPLKLFYYIIAGFQLLFLILNIYIFSQTLDATGSFFTEFGITALVVIAFAVVLLLVFAYPKTKLVNSGIFKWSIFAAMVIIFVLALVPLSYKFSSGPVIYAVEDTYQIVFTTSANGTAWVEIDGVVYYDTYGGSVKSQSKVHKITIDQELLDNAKSYTIGSSQMIMREAYDGLYGKTISQSYKFKPVDDKDGINYFVLSDTHGQKNGAISASKNVTNTDFVIMNGDISSYLHHEKDFLAILDIAYGTTKGQIPVVYARGNHETKGVLADQLYNYVGSKNQQYYYEFTLGSLWGVVLDMGEDHSDDWWEFYGTADYDKYRNEQTQWLKTIEADPNKTQRLVISHIPLNYLIADKVNTSENEGYQIPFQKAWVAELERIGGFDLSVYGHRHQLMSLISDDLNDGEQLVLKKEYTGGTANYSLAEGSYLKTSFNSFIVSRRSNSQKINIDESFGGKDFTGLSVSMNNSTTTVKYVNVTNTTINIVSPWTVGKDWNGNSLTFNNN